MKLTHDDTIRYRVQTGGQIAGPYTVEGLESLVYLGKITPDTPVSPEGADTFAPIRETALQSVLFPKPAPPQPPPAPPPVRPAANTPPERKHYKLTEAKFERVNAAAGEQPRLEVKDILHGIRQNEIKAGQDQFEPKRIGVSRRTREFWLLLIAGNTVLLGGAVLGGNLISYAFGGGGALFFTLALLWSMFGVMDKY